MFRINRVALAKNKRLLRITSLANALAATTPEEREHHLEIARLCAG